MKKIIFFFCCFFVSSSAMASGKNRNYFELNLSSVAEKFYPRLLLEDQNNFTDRSRFGLWTIIEFSGYPYTPYAWIEKGYEFENSYGLNQKLGLTYEYGSSKIVFGTGLSFTKGYLCPLLGFILQKEKFYFLAIGFYDAKHETGYDPNSWYKIQFLYSLSDHLDMGFVSERFYGIGIVSVYNLGSAKFKFMYGKETEFNKEVYQLSLMLKM